MRAAGVALLLASGCAYRVQLTTTPSAVVVELPDEQGTVVTPAEARFRYVPFGRQVITARAPGYRDLVVDLREKEIRLWRYLSDALWRPKTWAGGVRGEVHLTLVPEHGPAGTWTADDVP